MIWYSVLKFPLTFVERTWIPVQEMQDKEETYLTGELRLAVPCRRWALLTPQIQEPTLRHERPPWHSQGWCTHGIWAWLFRVNLRLFSVLWPLVFGPRVVETIALTLSTWKKSNRVKDSDQKMREAYRTIWPAVVFGYDHPKCLGSCF